MKVGLITVDEVVVWLWLSRECIRYCSCWCCCRSKVKQIQELLSQNPSFALRDVRNPVTAQPSQAVAGSSKFLKRASDEVHKCVTYVSFATAVDSSEEKWKH